MVIIVFVSSFLCGLRGDVVTFVSFPVVRFDGSWCVRVWDQADYRWNPLAWIIHCASNPSQPYLTGWVWILVCLRVLRSLQQLWGFVASRGSNTEKRKNWKPLVVDERANDNTSKEKEKEGKVD